MDDMRQEWQQLGSQLSGLGLKLQMHFQQTAREGRPEEADKLKEVLATLSESIDRTADALASIARDDAVKQDVRDVGRSLVSAVERSVGEVIERIRAPK